jgi:hypothetical protein
MMYLKPMVWSSIAVLLLSTPLFLFAADATFPVYSPPSRGAPGGRIGGGTRGGGQNVFVLSVLAPDHSAFTTTGQPSLYWYISKPTSLPVELTVMDPQGIKPILETQLPSPTKAGIQRVRLADYNVHLAPGAAYRWFVAVVPDADRRSKDILAGGAIERVDLQEDVKAKVAKASDKELPFVYAQAGLWYDALKSISDLIDAAPQNQDLQNQRTALLKQVGLPSTDE